VFHSVVCRQRLTWDVFGMWLLEYWSGDTIQLVRAGDHQVSQSPLHHHPLCWHRDWVSIIQTWDITREEGSHLSSYFVQLSSINPCCCVLDLIAFSIFFHWKCQKCEVCISYETNLLCCLLLAWIYFLIEYGWVLQIVFLVKGPLYLVSISATDEPAQALRKQLELLHGQVGPWFPSELTSTLLLLLGSESLRHLSCQTVCSVVFLLLLLLLFIFKN